MSLRLQRHPTNPLLLPNPQSDWECYNVFNPSVIRHNGLFHMHYRAQGLDWISRIGYAVSQDGITWNRLCPNRYWSRMTDRTHGGWRIHAWWRSTARST